MDVAVIGAGPAGSMAAKAVAEQGFAVTVYEKGPLKREKPCGGAVSGRVLREFDFKVREQFWDRPCTGIYLCSPQNETVALTSDRTMAYFVMREKFDYFLAREAQLAGASLVENAPAEPLTKNGKITGVRVNEQEIPADIVIACDGTPSSCARALNLYRGNDFNQAATYQYQMRLDNTEIDEKIGNNLEIYFGSSWVPYGYSWIFPKDGRVRDVVSCLQALYHNHEAVSGQVYQRPSSSTRKSKECPYPVPAVCYDRVFRNFLAHISGWVHDCRRCCRVCLSPNG
ncbi:MAG: NAD(P)/FAD-dependent oxidoreductase [Theionarchaea archaeon]|nr:NAD(P)/FAD-dependent oxidoreductase [Theionarchaea archaeon]